MTKLNQLFEEMSQKHGKAAELYHRLADSGDISPTSKIGELNPNQQEIERQMTQVQTELNVLNAQVGALASSSDLGSPDSGQNQAEPSAPVPVLVPVGVPESGPVLGTDTGIVNEPPVVTPPLDTQLLDHVDAKWLGGWYDNIWAAVHSIIEDAHGKPSILVAYNVQNRDNGNYSAGGVGSVQEYWSWSGSIADAIGSAPVYLVLEPDALGLLDQLSGSQKQDRYDALQGAIDGYKAKPNIKIYVDASMWLSPQEAANRLNKLHGFDGFSVNISGYETTEKCMQWAEVVSAITGYHYVVDTARNGLGNPHAPAWCNVTDTLIGVESTIVTASRNCDAYIHAKVAGESDGLGINDDGSHPRNDVPKAGEPFPEYKEAITTGKWDSFKQKFHV